MGRSSLISSPSVPRFQGQQHIFSGVSRRNRPESSFPVGLWLLGTGAGVAGMTLIGGMTRLTKSGLSMTSWSHFGSLPPINEEGWKAEFEQYKTFPEYSQRSSMTLNEFKRIFAWEYVHRMFGRVLGAVFTLPLGYFVLRKMIPKRVALKVYTCFGLGTLQGAVGWWMVKSGLKEELRDQPKEIRVSPYWLAGHLGMAFTTFSLLVHTGWDAMRDPKNIQTIAAMSPKLMKQVRWLRFGAVQGAHFAFLTALSGAFVAGNDAGNAYNCFPKMLPDAWLPEGLWEISPWWRNHFENTATVQLQHRIVAGMTLATVLCVSGLAMKGGQGKLWEALPSEAKRALALQGAAVTTQVALGISTLLLYVPIPLAIAHQVGALGVLGSSVWVSHVLRFARKL